MQRGGSGVHAGDLTTGRGMITKRDFTGGQAHTRGVDTPRERRRRIDAADQRRSAADFLPPRLSLSALRAAAARCTGCDLYKCASQTVFGEGPGAASVVFVGEQPGDYEDRLGHPFVGPAGKLLDGALQEAGIRREAVYITNAVKHFKWVARGKRRLHQRPREGEIDACRPWLEAELKVIKPRALVCLGATAARAAFGRAVRLTDYRGRFNVSLLAPVTYVTLHPSAILRLRDPQRAREYASFVADLANLRPYIA
jgi:uracil-DNA glycosylase